MTPIKQERVHSAQRSRWGPWSATCLPKPTFYKELQKKQALRENRADLRLLVNIVSVSYGCIRKEVDALVKFGGLGTARTNGTEIGKKLVWV